MTEIQVKYTVHERPTPIVPTEGRESVLLLVELRSRTGEEEEMLPCMQLVQLGQSCGGLGYCNIPTDEKCIICDRPVCPAHWSEQRIYMHAHEDDEAKNLFRLCQGCAILSREDAHALRALRLQLNG